MQLVDRLLAGDVRALARAISLVEGDEPRAVEILREIYPRTGKASVVGFTGAPGSGKSSLVDRAIGQLRQQGHRVGVVAVDPSSAFSGGAILGDRVRMQDHATDDQVFIRSMASRGHLGGLARATNDAIDLFDAAGYDPILVETVGVGQDEVEIVKTADTVCVVLVPGMGDDIQAMKAGILEIADLFVINKSDRDGADRVQADLEYMMSLVPSPDRAPPAIFRTVAVRNEGVEELLRGIESFRDEIGDRRTLERRLQRAEARFLCVLGDKLVEQVLSKALPDKSFAEVVRSISERRVDPYTAVGRVLERLEVR